MLHFMWDISLGIQYKLSSDTNVIKENTLEGASSYPNAQQKSCGSIQSYGPGFLTPLKYLILEVKMLLLDIVFPLQVNMQSPMLNAKKSQPPSVVLNYVDNNIIKYI